MAAAGRPASAATQARLPSCAHEADCAADQAAPAGSLTFGLRAWFLGLVLLGFLLLALRRRRRREEEANRQANTVASGRDV